MEVERACRIHRHRDVSGTSGRNTPGVEGASKAAVWALVSLFFQFTLCPIVTVRGLGEYTPLVMKVVRRESGPDGLAGFDELPQPAANIVANPTRGTRMDRAVKIGRLNSMNRPRGWRSRHTTVKTPIGRSP
jgi:hypothetical protein